MFLAPSDSTRAAEVERRWRLSLAGGGIQAQDEIGSDAANVLSVVNADGEIVYRYEDPRPDSSVTGNLEIRPGTIGTLAVQYALSRLFLVEASGGYQHSTVGDVEVQHVQAGAFRFPAGDLSRIPLELTALVRLRPEARLSPYFGGGFGYAIVGFEPSDALDQISLALDRSRARQSMLLPNNAGIIVPASPPPREMTGASVEADDAWEWHVTGGAELGFGEHWAAFFDLRYTVASRSFRLRFDDQDALGISVPQGRTPVGSDLAEAVYGPLYLSPGGLLDVNGDGTVDPGLYWVTGGQLRYDALAAQLGVRYTF